MVGDSPLKIQMPSLIDWTSRIGDTQCLQLRIWSADGPDVPRARVCTVGRETLRNGRCTQALGCVLRALVVGRMALPQWASKVAMVEMAMTCACPCQTDG